MSRTAVRVLAVVAVLAVVVGAYALVRSRQESAASTTGTGLTYDGRFYWASSAQVDPAALGDPVADDVVFQDTTADLRRIEGFDADVALAALLPPLAGGGGGVRWTFVSTDQALGTDPAGHPESAAVLAPTS